MAALGGGGGGCVSAHLLLLAQGIIPFPSVSSQQNKEDVCFIVLTKKEGSGLGFSVAGGTDVEPNAIVVSEGVEKLSGTSC